MNKLFLAVLSAALFFSCSNEEEVIDASANQKKQEFSLEVASMQTKVLTLDELEEETVTYTLETPDGIIENYQLTPAQAEYIQKYATTASALVYGSATGVDDWSYQDNKNIKLSVVANSNHDIGYTGIYIARKIWVKKKITLPNAFVVARADSHDWSHMGWNPADEEICGASAALDGFTLHMKSGCWYIVSDMAGRQVNQPFPKRFSLYRWKYIYQTFG